MLDRLTYVAEERDPEDESRGQRKLPMFWSPDGQNIIPTTWKALALLVIGAIVAGVLISWLS